MRTMRCGTALALAMTMSSGLSASAESLTDTLIDAYRNSPVLEVNRASLRSFDEAIEVERAAKRPQVTATGDATVFATTDSPTGDDFSENFSASVTGSLLLYDGGATRAGVQGAAADIDESRYLLANSEQDVMLDSITAYVDVRRDEQFVRLAQNNVDVITQQLQAAQDRFEVGEVTRTDVSQAEAALAAARSNVAINRGALEASRQAFRLVVGRLPGALEAPPGLPRLPATASEAQAISMQEHPTLAAARSAILAAEFAVEEARAGKRANVSANATLSYDVNSPFDTRLVSLDEDQLSLSAGVVGTIPLSTGGQLDALIRQSMAVLEVEQATLQSAARGIQQAVGLAFSQLEVARASIRASRQQVRSARVAFEGVQEEAKLGARTTLDVLDAEQAVLDAESNLAAALRDEYVAAYNLVAAMGLLSVKFLGLGIEEYDPDINFRAVTNEPVATSPEASVLDRISDRWN